MRCPTATLALLTVLSWHGLLTSAAAADEPPPALEVLRAAYVQSVTSLGSFDAEMRVRWSTTHARLAADPKVLTDYKIRILRDGKRELREILARSRSGLHENRIIGAYDGRRYLEFTGISEGPDGLPFLPHAKIGPTPPTLARGQLTLLTLLGEEIQGRALRDLLRDPTATVSGWDMVDGVRLVKVTIGPFEAASSKRPRTSLVTAWHDPQRGYLPTRMSWRTPADSQSLEASGSNWDFGVDEFRQFPALSPGWIPVRGYMTHHYARYDLVSMDIRPTSALPGSAFFPELPKGTKVDEIGLDGKRRSWIVGGSAARDELYASHQKLRQHLEQDRSSQTRTDADAVAVAAPSAKPVRAWWQSVSLWGALGALVMFSVAAFCWRRLRV